MRYQERIYAQNQHQGIRNKSILNVNMSSDLCVFTSPTFGMDGASKIECVTCCPSGYTMDNDGLSCTEIITTGATFNGSGATIVAGNQNSTYGLLGANFYQNFQNNESLPITNSSGVMYDQTGGTISVVSNVVSAFWGTGSTSTGRLNNVGISASTTEYLGFSKCLDIEEAGTYYVGLAADNLGRFRINGQMIVDLDEYVGNFPFLYWHVFPYYLNSGINIIELEGKNVGSDTAFGAEIYHPSNLAALTGATTTGDTGLIFSTINKIGSTFDVGTSIGYSCPSGYTLNKCGVTPECVIINKILCTGSTSGQSENIISTATTIPVTFNFTGEVVNTGSVYAEVTQPYIVTGVFGLPLFSLTGPLNVGESQTGIHGEIENGTITFTALGTDSGDCVTIYIDDSEYDEINFVDGIAVFNNITISGDAKVEINFGNNL